MKKEARAESLKSLSRSMLERYRRALSRNARYRGKELFDEIYRLADGDTRRQLDGWREGLKKQGLIPFEHEIRAIVDNMVRNHHVKKYREPKELKATGEIQYGRPSYLIWSEFDQEILTDFLREPRMEKLHFWFRFIDEMIDVIRFVHENVEGQLEGRRKSTRNLRKGGGKPLDPATHAVYDKIGERILHRRQNLRQASVYVLEEEIETGKLFDKLIKDGSLTETEVQKLKKQKKFQNADVLAEAFRGCLFGKEILKQAGKS